jgi:hypothetical protein
VQWVCRRTGWHLLGTDVPCRAALRCALLFSHLCLARLRQLQPRLLDAVSGVGSGTGSGYDADGVGSAGLALAVGTAHRGWGAGTPFVATESEGSIDADAYSVGAEEMWVKIVRDLEHEVACVATWPGDDEDAARECCNAYP